MLEDYANISLTLQNDGKFQLNAPNLSGQFAYVYFLESTDDYAERESQYMIYSSKEALKNIHQRVSDGGQGKAAAWDCTGEGVEDTSRITSNNPLVLKMGFYNKCWGSQSVPGRATPNIFRKKVRA